MWELGFFSKGDIKLYCDNQLIIKLTKKSDII